MSYIINDALVDMNFKQSIKSKSYEPKMIREHLYSLLILWSSKLSI